MRQPWLLLGPWLVACAPPVASVSAPGARSTAVVLGAPAPPPTPRPAPAAPGRNVPAIKVNTVGYPLGWRKLAVANVEPHAARVEDAAGTVALELEPDLITHRGRDAASRDDVWHLDLSTLETPGTYRVVSADASSDPFVVAAAPYEAALVAAVKMFYFQRTRTALAAPHATWEGDTFPREQVSHAHAEVGWLFEEFPRKRTRWPVKAGWHDAGNFDMYVPSTAPSAQALLLAYEAHPEQFQDGDAQIPESGNRIPDILDEAAWGIEWVLSMQAADGGFRLREANERLGEPGNGSAGRDRTTRWVDRVGSASTAKGCAMAAVAARVLAPHLPELAGRAERASRRAWQWLIEHPERVLVPPVGRAAQENAWQLWDDGPNVKSDVGARLLAAVETWRSFRERAALPHIERLLMRPEAQAAELERGHWSNLSRWALATLAQDPETPEPMRREARERLLTVVDGFRDRVEKHDDYLCATLPGDYYWGSNANLAEKAHLMVLANRLDPAGHGWGLEAAREQWHWLLGRNPNGFSMVTRIGKGPTALYHTEWGPLYPKVPPGYLVGGPNAHDMGFLAPGAPAKALLWDTPRPLTSGVRTGELWHWVQSDLWDGGFVRHDSWEQGWWAVTEPDIYYNAVLVLLAAEMQAPPAVPR